MCAKRFSFCFITDGTNDFLLHEAIKSIFKQKLKDFEIIVIGNTKLDIPLVRVISFDENVKHQWITRKKNLITEHALGEILFISHDYFRICSCWNSEILDEISDQDWDVGIPRILNVDGKRLWDWCLWPFNQRLLAKYFTKSHSCLIPYEESTFTNLMYVGGAYFACRKSFLAANPLDENRSWGEGEDVEWSIRLRDNWKLLHFTDLTVQSLKFKHMPYRDISKRDLLLIRTYNLALKSLPVHVKHLLRSDVSAKLMLKSLLKNF